MTERGRPRLRGVPRRLKKLQLGEIVRCQERQGFGFALKNALTRVRTPYVIVVQHDRNFVGRHLLYKVVKCLEKNDAWLKYVLLPTTTVLNYPRICPVEVSVENSAATNRIRLLVDTVAAVVR